ncbi:hypothetical protein SH1V18_37010 [Vallitalea longa]|uniref:Uncharacterized protein n=1 Tax=Vallitalea longa TaxID=2936439 RepID=A0A9W5YEJ0_9FIRM|nr:hypothetical protein [Vallitalea longa]GKX31221.1 hypothetical protein SH1V18_37010 [Vallitalea longa]
MNDDKIRNLFQNELDEELINIEFDKISQQKVIKKLRNEKKRNMLNRFLNYRIRINVNKLLVGVSVTVFAVVLLSYQAFRLTPDNIENSQIHYVQLINNDNFE